MTEMIPAGRMQLQERAAKQFGAMYRLEASIELDHVVGELVKIRASLINGCAFCIDMHSKDARASFEEEELAQLVFAITAINAWNRLTITARTEPGQRATSGISNAGPGPRLSRRLGHYWATPSTVEP
jgi:AhpD family alkylhydroperoxidase